MCISEVHIGVRDYQMKVDIFNTQTHAVHMNAVPNEWISLTLWSSPWCFLDSCILKVVISNAHTEVDLFHAQFSAMHN